MDHTTLGALLGLALFIGVTHTVMGPDHYIPFIAMSKAGRWSVRKTALITLVCGVGHVLSSVVLGLIGVALGLAVGGVEAFEGVRGDIAGWLLLGFGLAYMAWGIYRAVKNKPHTHPHIHDEGEIHVHKHEHGEKPAHAHEHASKGGGALAATPWALFLIFVFGPCEPLIPQLMYPAALGSWFGVISVAAVFTVATLSTMMVMVAVGSWGLSHMPSLERYTHATAGAAIVLCGLAIKLGL